MRPKTNHVARLETKRVLLVLRKYRYVCACGTETPWMNYRANADTALEVHWNIVGC